MGTKKSLLFSLFFFLLVFPSVFANFNIPDNLEYRVECENSTHLKKCWLWTECNSTSCENYNITQTVNCTSGCDQTYNKCKYVEENNMGNVVAFLGITFIVGMFFYLGMAVQPSEDFSKLKNGIQTLFFLVGFWLLLLDVGIVETIALSTGIAENSYNLIVVTITNVSRVIYVVMFLLFLSYLYSALWTMLPEK